MRTIKVDSSHATIVAADKGDVSHGVGPKLVDDADDKLTTTFDKGTPFRFEISKESYEGERSLLFQIGSEHRDEGEPQKSKIELNVVRQDESGPGGASRDAMVLKDGQIGFLGFGFKIDDHLYETPTRWVLHFQVFQCCGPEAADPGQRMQPPLVFQVEPEPPRSDGRLKFVLLTRDDTFIGTGANHDNGRRLRFLDGKDYILLGRGTWTHIAFALRPDPRLAAVGQHPDSVGSVAMWIGGHQVLDYRGPWGYSPEHVGPPDRYAIKLGIYRAAQPTVQTVYFSDIRWGDNLAAVLG